MTAANTKSATVYYTTVLTANDTAGATTATDTAGTSDGLDFGTPSLGSGVERVTLGSGYIYKVGSAVDELYIRATANFNSGAAFRARQAATAPTVSNMTTHGTQIWTGDSNSGLDNFAEGDKSLTSVAANTYFWFYPSASRTVARRTLSIIGGATGVDVASFSSGLQSSGDGGGLSDPLNLGPVSSSNHFVTESLGNSGGVVYKTTSHLSYLNIVARGQFNNGAAFVARWSTTKPTTTNMDEDAGGTQIFSASSDSSTRIVFGTGTLKDVAAGTYFWFYPSTNSRTLSQRSLVLTGALGTPDKPLYTASYTLTSNEDEVAAGSLKYDVTNETSVKDAAGNNIAAKAVTMIAGYSFSKTLEATIGAVSPTTKAKSKTVALTGVTDGATVKYKLITGSTCDATAYTGGSGETTVTITSGSGTATVTNESDNSKYLCFKLTKSAHTDTYFISGQVTGIDDTAPTVTSGSTGYYETFTASNRTFGTAASGAYKATDDIYTKVTFSEDMTQTVGTGGTAKPVIKYSIAGTETQYEIVATGTGSLDSGKCRPNHATETDEYVCRYTVASV